MDDIVAYDVVLLAEREEELKAMMNRFKKYLGRKDLLLSVAKSKVMVFEKVRGGVDRKGRREWSWGEEKTEKISEIKYLSYILQKNGKAGKYINERLRRAMVAVKMTWSMKKEFLRMII